MQKLVKKFMADEKEYVSIKVLFLIAMGFPMILFMLVVGLKNNL